VVSIAHAPEPLALPLLGGRGLWPLAVLLALGLGVWVTLWLRGVLGRRSRQRRAARAIRAERNAASLLEAHGFAVLGRQVRQRWALSVDGQELPFTLVADYLVERQGLRWVAEVKTGERSLDLRHGPTRRQLLEYREAFAADGVLLVDTEGQTLRNVRFRGAAAGRSPSRLAAFVAMFALGLAAGFTLAASAIR
jgi:hypothetical protein